jgi:hypothetical protein
MILRRTRHRNPMCFEDVSYNVQKGLTAQVETCLVHYYGIWGMR